MTEADKLRQERDQWRDEALRLRERERLRAMHMYVWTDQYSFTAIAQADSVQKARAMVLEQIGTSDGSCPERIKARRVVQEMMPTIWHGNNAEFCLRDSAELREQEDYASKLFAENEALKKRLESATEFRFEGYFLRRPLGGRWEVLRRPLGGRWEVVEPGWNCLFCSLPDASTRPPSCYFDTYEEAEAAALKALEVAG